MHSPAWYECLVVPINVSGRNADRRQLSNGNIFNNILLKKPGNSIQNFYNMLNRWDVCNVQGTLSSPPVQQG